MVDSCGCGERLTTAPWRRGNGGRWRVATDVPAFRLAGAPLGLA